MLPEKDRHLASKSQLLDSITGLLGGRVSESLVFQDVTTGAQNDLQRATDISRAMVCEYGMSEKLGTLTFGRHHGNPFLGRDIMEDRNYSEDVASAIDSEVRQIIDNCHQRAVDILSANRDQMDNIVQELLVKETLNREEFLALIHDAKHVIPTTNEKKPLGETKDLVDTEDSEMNTQSIPKSTPRLEPGPA
jgi:cell division protease FtsH